MKQRTRSFLAAFFVTLIFLVALCGFMAVDMSTDRYMPGQFSPMYLVSRLDETGAEVSFMGVRYTISAEALAQAQQQVWQHRSLLPHSMRIAGALTVQLIDWVESLLAG